MYALILVQECSIEYNIDMRIFSKMFAQESYVIRYDIKNSIKKTLTNKRIKGIFLKCLNMATSMLPVTR